MHDQREMYMRSYVHLFDTSGSGTTSIAKKISRITGYDHFDADECFWLPTDEPFTKERPNGEAIAMMKRDLSSGKHWILRGSLLGWAEELISYFNLAVFVTVPRGIRLERIKNREFMRYNDAILLGVV